MGRLMIFTPTWETDEGNAIRPECAEAIRAQVVEGGCEWIIGTHNPFPQPDNRNVLAQYQRAREIFLSDGYEAMLTVEHDSVLPDEHATQRMLDTDADVVYGVYILRHNLRQLNAWQYIGQHHLGGSLSYNFKEFRQARTARAWRVCGAGFGCTLFRRHVLEQIPFRPVGADSFVPDVPFAEDALRAGFVSMARFDVPVKHWDNGQWLNPFPEPGELGYRYWPGAWKGIQQWNCRYCKFDTLEGESTLLEHVDAVHGEWARM